MKLAICNQLNLFLFSYSSDLREICAICCVDMMERKFLTLHTYINGLYMTLERESEKYLKNKVVNHAEYCNRDISASETMELVLESRK